MHAARGSSLACFLAILSIAVPAHAQDETEASATITLRAQTPWTTPEDPVLRLSIRLRNLGDTTIPNPEVGWILGPKVLSRVQYETSLVEGPAFPASAETLTQDDDLRPGDPLDVPIRIDTSDTGGIDQADSGVYPLMVELRSEGERIAALTTAAIHLVQPPRAPIPFSWWTEIAAPVAFAPDGRLIDRPWERTLASGGGTAAQVGAIADVLAEANSPRAVDLVVSPAALDQLHQAADGYRTAAGDDVGEESPLPRSAAAILQQLREIASDPGVRLHAMPFAAPNVPALLSGGLRRHLEMQWQMGDEVFERLIGEPPDPTVARPPGLAFDAASLNAFETHGATTILGAADSVPRPPHPLGYAPPPVAVLSGASDERIEIVLPDPGAQAMLDDRELLAEPVRAAQAVLGELATIWKELPVPPEGIVRGLALDLHPNLPSRLWQPLVRRLTTAPFLQNVHAEDLAGRIMPAPRPAGLRPTTLERFSFDYVNDLLATEADVTAFDAMVAEDDPEPDRLRRAILYAEASQYVGAEGTGRMWIDSVNAVTDPTFARLAPDTSRVLTFTSRSGTIPLRMGDPGERVVDIRIELASTRVDFQGGGTKTVRLDRANQVITFEAEVKAAGRSSIDVLVRSPSGLVLSRSVLVVSSTAVNPIALIITVGAGLVLVGLWSRRLFRRRNA